MTAIQWTDATWNPVTGCTRISPGCARCYIERTPPFRMAGRRFARVGSEATTGVQLHPDRLSKPVHWRKPRRVFVCSLADLFHDEVPDHFIYDVFQAMYQAPQHVFQVLTKRPERLLAWYQDFRAGFIGGTDRFDECWPLPNVWLGVSIENARYTWRADVLREIPAVVRFISAEPLLDSLFEGFDNPKKLRQFRDLGMDPCLRGRGPLDLTGIDWLIAGGESGPGARGCDLAWIRELREACREAGAAFFVKQLGSSPYTWEHPPHLSRPFRFAAEIRNSKGGDISEWPADLRIREFPRTPAAGSAEAVPSLARAEAS